VAAATPPEVRKARAFLRSKGVTSKEVPPRKLANAAKELNKGFRETIRLIMHLRSGGQGQSQARRRNIQREAEK
jgi:hypothetical protein